MVIHESETVASHFNTLGVQCKILRETHVSLAQAGLHKGSFAFLAAHAEADWNVLSESAILMGSPGAPTEQRLTVNVILDARMGDCRLVYLSSFESVMTLDLESSDEGLSLAGAFQMKGAKHVVSALWQVDDKRACRAATRFFRSLGGRWRSRWPCETNGYRAGGRCAPSQHPGAEGQPCTSPGLDTIRTLWLLVAPTVDGCGAEYK